MKIDDLMEVWRSQDEAPLHGVNETLLRLALRQDEAKLLAQRRWERAMTYFWSAVVVAAMAFFIAVMIYPHDDDVLTGRDYSFPAIGAIAALLWARTIFVSHRTQAAREERLGDSLRDQVDRQIAQLDFQVAGTRFLSVLRGTWMPVICASAIVLSSWRINDRPLDDPGLWTPVVFMIFWTAITVTAAWWWQLRTLRRNLLPHKRRLETLLRDLEDRS